MNEVPAPIPSDDNDDITEYITDSSFESLKKRFGEAEEDESIRNEDFNPLSTSIKGAKKSDDILRSAPSFKSDPMPTDTIAPLKSAFGTAESRFDSDAISFDDIEIDLNSYNDLTEEVENKPSDKTDEYDTNTRVIYVDNDMDDGIKRNTDLEVSSVFSPD